MSYLEVLTISSIDKYTEIKSKISAGKVNDALVKALRATGIESFTRIERNLYFRISKSGTGFWVYQYKINNKPKRMTLGTYGKRPDKMPLSDARAALAENRALVQTGIDPLAEKKRVKKSNLYTVRDLANDWLKEIENHLENPHIPKRIYYQEIDPRIGGAALNSVTGLDVRHILEFVKTRKKTARPTIVNDTLMYLKQLFDHGITLGIIHNNPAIAFKNKHAGGTEKSRERTPSLNELKTAFEVMRKYPANFSRENYLALALIVVLGVRKGELIALPWKELDLENGVWYLPATRAKNKYAIDIPLPEQVIQWFKELRIRAGNSDYVFPSRRASKRRGYISDDTLNHALTNLFGRKTGKLNSSTGNVLGNAGLEYFTIHDLRRSTRTIMTKNGVSSDVAEKCLNHVKNGVEGVYNRHAYFEERIAAHQQLAEQIASIVNCDN